MNKNNYVVIMAGGIGSRFWPYSRTRFPKQFHDILGVGKSMLQQTADRFANICPKENIYIVTNKIYLELVEKMLPFLSRDQILLEPLARNTAPCIAYACYKIYKKNPDANIVVTPSDQFVLKEEVFEETIKSGLNVTSGKDALVTIGILPSRPDIGYGYIQYEKEDEHSSLKKVKKFKEKPDYDTALDYLRSGNYVWNSGLFIWTAKAIKKAFQSFMPVLHTQFEEGNNVYYSRDEENFIETIYPLCENISIDYGIMEKANNVYVILADYGWSDVGTWKSVYDISDKTEDGNVIAGNVLVYNTKDCIIKTPSEKLVVVNGLEGFIIAEHDGVLMICKKDDEQKVKEFVAEAKAKFADKFM